MPATKDRRKAAPRGKPPRGFPPLPEEQEAAPPTAADLLDWQLRIQREPDPRQSSLPLEPSGR
jgi:hypothetical protein